MKASDHECEHDDQGPVRSPERDCETDEPGDDRAKAVEGQGISGYVLLIMILAVPIVILAFFVPSNVAFGVLLSILTLGIIIAGQNGGEIAEGIRKKWFPNGYPRRRS